VSCCPLLCWGPGSEPYQQRAQVKSPCLSPSHRTFIVWAVPRVLFIKSVSQNSTRSPVWLQSLKDLFPRNYSRFPQRSPSKLQISRYQRAQANPIDPLLPRFLPAQAPEARKLGAIRCEPRRRWITPLEFLFMFKEWVTVRKDTPCVHECPKPSKGTVAEPHPLCWAVDSLRTANPES
jgi:hypothetical protein